MGAGTVSDALIKDLQSLLAINRRRQSSRSSPQKAWIFFAAMSSAAASARAFSLRLSSCYWGCPDSVDSDQGLAVVSVRAVMNCCS